MKYKKIPKVQANNLLLLKREEHQATILSLLAHWDHKNKQEILHMKLKVVLAIQPKLWGIKCQSNHFKQ